LIFNTHFLQRELIYLLFSLQIKMMVDILDQGQKE
jgi:hypothetical protein